MPGSVALRSLRDQRKSLSYWALGLMGLVGMYVGMYPSMRGNSSYSDIINQMPETLRAMFTAGSGGDITSGPGYLSIELLSFMGPLLMLMYAVGAGASAIAGEEDRRTLDLLLANPVSRRRVVVEKFAAMVSGVVLLSSALALATIGLGAATDMGLSAANVAATMLHLALLTVLFGAMALLIGCVTGRVGLSRGVPAMVAVVTYLINGFGVTVDWLRPLRPLSPFYQYLGHDPIRQGLSLLSVGVAVATIAALLGGALWAFDRRDVTG